MRDEKDNIDALLERNAAEQLSQVDWDGLNAAIIRRLDRAGRRKAVPIGWRGPLKIAAPVAVAAVVVIAVMLRTDEPLDLHLTGGRTAVVRFTESKGSASVKLAVSSAEPRVFVEVGAAENALAKCDVDIIDVDGERERNGGRPAWIIITRPEPLFADNGAGRNIKDLICMF